VWYNFPMRIKLVVFLAVFPVFLVFSSPYDMIPAGDPVLDDLLFLSLESGKPVLSFTPPLALHEIQKFLESIDVSILPHSAQEAYDRIINRLNPVSRISISSDYFLFALDINSTLEARARFNKDVSWLGSHVPPLLSIPVKISFADYVQLYFEPMAALDPELYPSGGVLHPTGYLRSPPDYISFNVPYRDFLEMDQNFPLRAYIAAGRSFWNFQLGRDRLSFGTGQMGNLAVSDNPSFHEFARLSFFSKIFKYSVLVSQMPLNIGDIYKMDQSHSRPCFCSSCHTNQRYFYLHRLDVKLFDKLSISLTEGLIAGNSGLEIRYLNPMMIFHSMYSFWNYALWDGGNDEPEGYETMNGSLFSLEINWNIIKSLAVYGQFVMNQFSTQYEAGKGWGETEPNGLGYLIGMRFSRSFGRWASVFYFEFIYTDPYLFMNPSPFGSFIQMRYLGGGMYRYQYSFIGFPRDTITAVLGANFFDNDKLRFSVEFNYISQGEYDLVWNWVRNIDAFYEKTPTGIAENKFIASLGTEWKINTFFIFKGNISGIYSINNDHNPDFNVFGGQVGLSVNFRF